MENKAELKRTLSLFACVMIMISSVIGSGIFTVPGEIMAAAQGSGTNFMAWIIAGVCVFLMATVYIELAPAMPQAGGGYVYLNKAFGAKVAFFYGWGKMVNEVAVMALYALACTSYISFFIPLGTIESKVIGTIILIAAASFNIAGVKKGSFITNILTVAKLAGLAIVIIGGLFVVKGANFQPVVSETAGWGAAAAAAVPAFFAFGGYNQLCYMSEEIKEPEKTLPRALLIGITCIVAIYLLLTFVCIGTLGVEGLANSDKSVAMAAAVIFGSVGGGVIAVCALTSILASLNAMFMSTPRVAFSMGRDGVYPFLMAKTHPKYDTPYVAISFYGIFAIVLLWLGSFSTLLMMCVFIARVMDVLVAASLMVLRKKFPEMPRPFKMKGYPVTLFIAIALCLFLAFQVPVQQMVYSIVLCIVGLPVYFITQYVNRKYLKN